MKALAALPLALCLSACAANAPPVTSFGELPDRIDVGDLVTVRAVDDEHWRGRVESMTPDQVVLRVADTDVAVAADGVRRVSKCCDSPKDGPLIGLVAGGAIAWLAFGTSSEFSGGDALLAMAWFGGLGAAAGFGLDVMIGHEVDVYRAPSATMRIVVDPAGRHVRLVLRW